MTCNDATERLHDALDGLLDDGERAALEEHVAGCAACARESDDLAHLRRVFRAVPPVSAPEGFTGRVMGALPADADANGKRPAGRLHRLPVWLAAVAAVAAVLLVALYADPARDELGSARVGEPGAPAETGVAGAAERRDALASRYSDAGSARDAERPQSETSATRERLDRKLLDDLEGGRSDEARTKTRSALDEDEAAESEDTGAADRPAADAKDRSGEPDGDDGPVVGATAGQPSAAAPGAPAKPPAAGERASRPEDTVVPATDAAPAPMPTGASAVRRVYVALGSWDEVRTFAANARLRAQLEATAAAGEGVDFGLGGPTTGGGGGAMNGPATGAKGGADKSGDTPSVGAGSGGPPEASKTAKSEGTGARASSGVGGKLDERGPGGGSGGDVAGAGGSGADGASAQDARHRDKSLDSAAELADRLAEVGDLAGRVVHWLGQSGTEAENDGAPDTTARATARESRQAAIDRAALLTEREAPLTTTELAALVGAGAWGPGRAQGSAAESRDPSGPDATKPTSPLLPPPPAKKSEASSHWWSRRSARETVRLTTPDGGVIELILVVAPPAAQQR